MPQATDIIVNNGAATPVAKTFSLVAPMSGYGGIAEWLNKEGGSQIAFPKITYTARDITSSSRRKCQIKVRLPATYIDPTTGMPALLATAEFNGEVTMPHAFPEANKADFIAFVKNVISHALMSGSTGALKDATPLT